MPTTRHLALAFVAGAACALIAPALEFAEAPRAHQPVMASSSLLGQHELDEGSFEIYATGVATPVAFVWSRFEEGKQIETWALFRPNTASGWTFPSSDETSVSVTFEYEADASHDDLQAFLKWCEDRYPAAMNVDCGEDFEVHEHRVSVL